MEIAISPRGTSMVLTTQLYTAEDLWAMPGGEPWEIWDGELRKVPSAGGRGKSSRDEDRCPD